MIAEFQGVGEMEFGISGAQGIWQGELDLKTWQILLRGPGSLRLEQGQKVSRER